MTTEKLIDVLDNIVETIGKCEWYYIDACVKEGERKWIEIDEKQFRAYQYLLASSNDEDYKKLCEDVTIRYDGKIVEFYRDGRVKSPSMKGFLDVNKNLVLATLKF